MNNVALILAEIVSAALSFILVGFMRKPYQYTGENRYIGLPLGFAFLGMSYLFMGFALSSNNIIFVEEMKWLQLFTQAYAFAFLATTYYFSKQTLEQKTRLWSHFILSALLVGLIISYLIVFVPPIFALPSYKAVDEYFRGFNIIFASYIALWTLRSHALKPDPKTIWAPLGYLLLAFGQCSSLIWSLDSSFSAFVGAHIIRLAGLLVFLYVSYEAFAAPHNIPTRSKGS
jgi:hypothetical protein